MDCIEALDVLSQALWTPDFFGTQFGFACGMNMMHGKMIVE